MVPIMRPAVRKQKITRIPTIMFTFTLVFGVGFKGPLSCFETSSPSLGLLVTSPGSPPHNSWYWPLVILGWFPSGGDRYVGEPLLISLRMLSSHYLALSKSEGADATGRKESLGPIMKDQVWPSPFTPWPGDWTVPCAGRTTESA